MTTTIAKLCLTIAMLAPAAALAAPQSVTESARYTLADNDSRNDARQICASTAKRTALDKAGSLFESDLTAHKAEANGAVADDTRLQMRSYVAAVVGSEVVSERFEMDHDRLTVACTVKVTFDPDEVSKKLQEIAGNTELRRKLAAQQAEMDILANQVRKLSATMKPSAPNSAAAPLPLPSPALQQSLAAPQAAVASQTALSALPPPQYVPSRPNTYIDAPTQAAAAAPPVAIAPQATLSALPPPRYVPPLPYTYAAAPAQAPAPPQQVQAAYQPYQTATVTPQPAPAIVYYYYRPVPAYAARAAYLRRLAYARWYYASRQQW
jgi:hypothetical protein